MSRKNRYEYTDWKGLGNRVKSYREQIGITKEKFAEMINRTENYLSELEKGNRSCSVHTLHQIAIALRLPVDKLLYGDNMEKKRESTNKEILHEIINRCNEEKIPVILQLPTFKHLDTKKLMESINYDVDADGFAREWIGEINLGNDKKLAPATPKGVISLLEQYNVDIEGKIALVIGKSNHVGKPLCTMLMNRGATLINANSKTKDLSSLVKMADIIISCVGRQNLIKSEDIKEDAVVIGVGFTYVNGKQILDFDVDEIVALGKAKFVSNRINCTGKATINSLIDNVIELYKMIYFE